MALVVNWPLAIIRAVDGKLHHFYKGAPVPSGLDKAHVDHLVAEGALINDAKAAPKADVPAATPDPTPVAPKADAPAPAAPSK